MRRNAERDRVSTALAQEQGWHVIRVWECEVSRDADAVARPILVARHLARPWPLQYFPGV
jgi:DNA mismatch endonuclease (patch repair protein)